VLAVLFLVGALALGILGQRGPGSVLGGRAPAAAPTTPLPTGAAQPAGTPAPAAGTTKPATTPAPAEAPK
jgi:hypothetical protein